MKQQKGKVWLVGGGPSDPGLMTLKGKFILGKADVVVYDALIGAGILSMIPQDTRRIYVGKRAGHHSVPQEQINQILLEEAQKGNRVVRLKGGDPFVFGRGGEELDLLKQNGIPFEIVPGITSAIAVPAYAGIPVTHRDCCSSLHIITAHSKAGNDLELDYRSLVKLKGTLIFLMGVSALKHLCENLILAGMPPETPAAIVENGTSAHQRKVTADLGTLPALAANERVTPPSIIVVGKVCALSSRFSWTEERPLNGIRILVTRPRERLKELCQNLSELGAETIAIPTIAIHKKKLLPEEKKIFENLDRYQWIVLTSPSGVACFFEHLMEQKIDIRRLSQHFAVIGSATETALKEKGIFADLIPKTYCAEALGKGLAQCMKPGEKALLARAEKASPMLPYELNQAGISYTELPTYTTVLLERDQEMKKMIQQKEVDLITFTSASTVQGFVQAVDGMDCRTLTAVCIGEQTAQQARQYGMNIEIAEQATTDSMVNCILAAADRIRSTRTKRD